MAEERSSINATGKAVHLIADIDDRSFLNAKYLSTETAQIRAENIGKVDVRVKDSLMAVVTNTSNVMIRGSPKVKKYVDSTSKLNLKR